MPFLHVEISTAPLDTNEMLYHKRGGDGNLEAARSVATTDLSHLSVKRLSRVTVCCAGLSKVSQAQVVAPWTFDKSSSEFQEGPLLQTAMVYYIKYKHEDWRQ